MSVSGEVNLPSEKGAGAALTKKNVVFGVMGSPVVEGPNGPDTWGGYLGTPFDHGRRITLASQKPRGERDLRGPLPMTTGGRPERFLTDGHSVEDLLIERVLGYRLRNFGQTRLEDLFPRRVGVTQSDIDVVEVVDVRFSSGVDRPSNDGQLNDIFGIDS